MLVIGGAVAVDLVQNPLHRSSRHGVDDVDEGAGLPRPDLLDNPLGHPVEFGKPVVEQRVDRDLADQGGRRIASLSQPTGVAVVHGQVAVWLENARARARLKLARFVLARVKPARVVLTRVILARAVLAVVGPFRRERGECGVADISGWIPPACPGSPAAPVGGLAPGTPAPGILRRLRPGPP